MNALIVLNKCYTKENFHLIHTYIIHVITFIHIHIHIYTFIHTYTHSHTHRNIHTYFAERNTHRHTHTHTHKQDPKTHKIEQTTRGKVKQTSKGREQGLKIYNERKTKKLHFSLKYKKPTNFFPYFPGHKKRTGWKKE